MSKRFITLKEAENYICDGKIYIDKNAILASTLQDYLRENEIAIIYEKKECSSEIADRKDAIENKIEKTENKQEDISSLVAKILKRDFNIQDGEKIKQVIKIIREVLK